MTTLVGIVNITADSFSDGGQFLDPDAAVAHATQMLSNGADLIELGPASSNPLAGIVPDEVQIQRLRSVVDALLSNGVEAGQICFDVTPMRVQRCALGFGGAYLGDISGFPEMALYAELAASDVPLVVMHSVHGGDRARSVGGLHPDNVVAAVTAWFRERIAVLEQAGISRRRLILDPGMGFFLGEDPQTSLTMLREIGQLRQTFDLPVMISVSRKSFLRKITGRVAQEVSAATLAAELYACSQGVDYVRTHDPAALKDALLTNAALNRPQATGAGRSRRRGRD